MVTDSKTSSNTPTRFSDVAAALMAHGYLVIPIRPGEKRPAMDDWPNARLTATDVPRFARCGVGVLCGQGESPIVGLDIDALHEPLAKEFTEWCHGKFGHAPVRIGNYPKTLLLYRASKAGWKKSSSARFTDAKGQINKLEVLGDGEQFVAYGIHPDTQKPYSWGDPLMGDDPVHIPVCDLPGITPEQVQLAIQKFEEHALKHGLKRVDDRKSVVGAVAIADDDPFAGHVQREGLAIDEARRLIELLDSGANYDYWIKVGMALHHEFEGSEEALSLWDEWSSTSPKYKGLSDLQPHWGSFKNKKVDKVTAIWLKKVSRDAREALRKAEKNDALDEIKSLVGGCDNPIDLMSDVASRVGALAHGDAALRAVAEGAVRSRFKDLTGNAILTAEVRRALDKGRRALKQGQSKRHPDTELGNTDRMIDRYGDTLLFAKDTKQWYRWNGVHWKPIYEADMIYLALETVRALPDEIAQIKDDQERLGFFDFCKLSQRESMVRHMLILAQADERVGIVSTDLDRHMHLLGVGNGVVDLRTGELLLPDPTHMISIITPVEYDPRAKAPLFEATLLDACNGDVNLSEFNKRTYGYAILGNPREQVMAIPYGSGANGKSTILNTVRDVLGDHATNASSGVFLSNGRKGTQTGGQPELLVLRGKRFVYVDEPDQGAELRESLVKTITGNDKISARWMYSNAMVNFKPSWVAFMPTNHRPIVKGDDYAIWRRLLTIPFTRNFDKDPSAVKDPDRAEKLKAEYQGILALLVRYAMKYQKEGLNPPPDVHKAREDYKQDMDLLADWLEECCELGGGCVSSNAELWTSWSAFARDRGELDYIKSARALGRRLSGREGMTPVQRYAGMRGRGFRGIKVKRVGDFE